MELRQYQTDQWQSIENAWRNGYSSPILQSPTGSGKSIVVKKVVDNHYDSKKVIYVVAHRKKLVRQLSGHLTDIDIPHGIIMSRMPYISYRVQVCSMQTLVTRLHKLPEPDIIIFDEAHHCKSKSYLKIINHWPGVNTLGITATPSRPDGNPLSDVFDLLIPGPEVRWLIDNGFLSEYDYYAPPDVNMEGAKVRMGEFTDKESEERVDKNVITGSAIEHYRKYADHKPCLVACVSIAHTEHVAQQFREAGYKAQAIHSKMDDTVIEKHISGLSDGSVEVLCNADLISEGVDIPGIEVLIMLKPTNSIVVFLQLIGRVLRIAEGKMKAIILDHVGNFERHGLPDDEREWDLSGAVKHDKKYKRCPECRRPVPISTRVCTFCGFRWSEVEEQGERELPKEVEGTLVKITQRPEIRKDLVIDIARRARSLKTAIAIAKKHGIAHTSAYHIWVDVLKNKP